MGSRNCSRNDLFSNFGESHLLYHYLSVVFFTFNDFALIQKQIIIKSVIWYS